MKRYIHALAIVAWVWGIEAHCQEITPPDTMRVNIENEIVVTATRNETDRKSAPALVELTTAETMERCHSVCLAQGLRFTTGLRVEDNCQNCGSTDVRINGLDGHYSQILIDSRPIISALSGVYGLEQIPVEMIDRIEVVRGGGSALYGASAIGGTINIITKEGSENAAAVSHTFMSIGGSKSFDNVTGLTASLVSGNKHAGIYIFAQNRQRDAYDHNKDGYSDIPSLKGISTGFKSFLYADRNSKLTLQYNFIKDSRRGGNKLNSQPHEANIAESADHDIHSFQFGYNGSYGNHRVEAYTAMRNTRRNNYCGGTGSESEEEIAAALNAYGYTHDLNLVAGALYSYNFQKPVRFTPSITFGAEYNYDFLNDSVPGYQYKLTQRVHILSSYIQNEWKSRKCALLLGGRLDKHNLIKRPILSPRVNVMYTPVSGLTFRAGYAGGFRAPQAFDEDLHVSVSEGERVTHILSEDLKEERSQNVTFSASYTYNHEAFGFEIESEGFYTQLKDIFAEKRYTTADNQEVAEKYNADKGYVYGIHFETKVGYAEFFSATLGLTWQQSLYSEALEWSEEAPAEKRMLRTPDLYGYILLSSNPWRTLSLNLSGNLTGSMLVPHDIETPVLVKTPTFFDMSFRISYDFTLLKPKTENSSKKRNGVFLQIGAFVQNIFNSFQKDLEIGVARDSGYIYGPSLPRTFGCNIKLMYR